MMARPNSPAAIDDREPPPGYRKVRPSARRRKQRGAAELLEFLLVLMPFLAFLFVLLDVAWGVYSQSVLQYAVAQGVRYAVTSQTMNGLGQRGSIQTVVQQYAFGRLSSNTSTAGTNGWNNIYVDWYLPDGTNEDGVVGGNGEQNGVFPLVKVSVQSLTLKTLMPSIIVRGQGQLSALSLTAQAWDRMEAPPLTGIPAQ
jgi:Flp pilus assembly protein TadG